MRQSLFNLASQTENTHLETEGNLEIHKQLKRGGNRIQRITPTKFSHSYRLYREKPQREAVTL